MALFAKIDDVDGDAVLFHFLCKTDKALRCVVNRRGDEDYDALFL